VLVACGSGNHDGVAIPSKPGQRLQSAEDSDYGDNFGGVAIPSKPGQRLQSAMASAEETDAEVSQSLPNQVNDFNYRSGDYKSPERRVSQSLPNQVNDFNAQGSFGSREHRGLVAIPSKPGQRLQSRRRRPGQTCPGMSQSLPNQVNDFNYRPKGRRAEENGVSQSLPNQVNDFNQRLEQ